MNPAAIVALTQICEARHLERNKEVAHLISNFLTAWSAWEAVRTRLLRVVIHKQGWLMQDADTALRVAKLSSMKKAATLLQRLGLPNPSNWKGQSGQTWRTLLVIEPLRHRLTHGFQTADPKLIKIATDIVLSSISNQQWLENLDLPSIGKTKGNTRLGSVMSPRGIIGKTNRRSPQELFDILQLENRKVTSCLPSLNLLERRLSKMELQGATGCSF
jgi:hypothetical protein